MSDKKKKKTSTKLPSTAAEFRSTVLKKLRNNSTKTSSGNKYVAASSKVKKSNKNYQTADKYNKYYQMTSCSVLKKMDGTPETDLAVYNQLLENDKEVETMINDLKTLTQKGDTNLATIKAGINSLMKNELNEVTFNVGGTAPLYEMIYHIDENLNEHIKDASFTSFQTEFKKAALKHAKIETDYFQEYTRQVYKVMKTNLKNAEIKYNEYAKAHSKNSDVAQNYDIPTDGKWTDRFKLVSGKDTPVASRDSYTLLKENEYGQMVYNRNDKKRKYSPIRKKAKELSGTIK